MAYRSLLMVVADGAIIDQESNMLSVFNILEDLSPFGYPFLIPRIVAVCWTARDPGDAPAPPNCSMQFRLDEEVLLQTGANIDFGDRPRNRFKLTVSGLVIPRPGKLTVSLIIDNLPVHSYAITITPAINPGAAGGAAAAPPVVNPAG